ncbi:ATP-grasp enzyme-like protein [Photobacterium aphoticum]|uniref:ATP-grasp enzyme-like protein n=1 Tax=Photobacterium aphoticum TaxID=754436 RepID=A0A090QTR5_9GAMM|nr:ATP-grasp enzyme-like protein [Photobacterium aphoticum]
MQQGRTPTALILGEDTRSFLSVIRSLGKAGYDVHVVCYDRTSPALASRYIKIAKYYNYQAYSQAQWLVAVQQLIARYRYDVIIPCDERAIYPLWSVKDTLPANTQLAIANDRALDVLFDKWKTKQLALSCDVPVAKGKLVQLSDTHYDALAEEFGERFVIKPLQSFDENGLNKRQNVSIVHQASDFNQIPAGAEPVMVEAFFSGYGEGVSVFSVDGEIHMAFSHRREAEPKHGGGSSYRQSVAHDPAQLDAVMAMCKATHFTGVAMFEFRRDPQTQAWILVEVNARFWGSLPLACYCGVDFPAAYAHFLLTGERPVTPVLTYPVNRYARALTADFYQLRRDGIRDGLHRLIQYGRIGLGKERIDSFIWPIPCRLSKRLAAFFHKSHKVSAAVFPSYSNTAVCVPSSV